MKRLPSFGAAILAVAFFLARPAQADLEGIARLYFEANTHAREWIEGFDKALDGDRLSYHSHRSPQVDGRIVRATGMTASWRTAVVPETAAENPRTFLWVAGMADKGSHEEFVLTVNDAHKITFHLSKGWSWTVKGDEGATLTFAAETREGSDDLFGYMKLTIPASWARAGQPVTLKLSAADVKSTAGWVQTFEHADSLAELSPRLPRNVFFEYQPDGPRAGTLKLICPADMARKTVTVHAGKTELGVIALESNGQTASAFMPVPATTLRDPFAELSVTVDGKIIDKTDMLPLARYRLRTFLNETLELESYILTPGQIPAARWKRPDIVRSNMGDFPLTVTLYDARMKEVPKTDKPGRYGVVVAAQTPDGFPLRRYYTVVCIPQEVGWRDNMGVTAQPHPKYMVPADVMKLDESAVNKEMGDLVRRQAPHDPSFAAALAGFQELGGQADLPAYQRNVQSRDRQWWVTFKRQQAGAQQRYAQFQRPAKIAGNSAPTLHEGDPASVGYSPASLEKIDRIATEWVQEGKEPLSFLVARKGVIVFHKAYGKNSDGSPFTLQTPAQLASTTKLLTGIVAMQFVDQGLLALDEPVKKHLPELDRPVLKDITLRHMLTHTAGFDSYGEWGMDYNHSFENCVGQFAPCLEPGKSHYYNGNSFALTGKTLERISGRCIPYLFEEHLFGPMGCTNSRTQACDSMCDSTPMDLARIGQMMLNKGAYGNLRFFSEENYASMIPASLEKTVGVKVEYGLGMAGMYDGLGMDRKDNKIPGMGGASGASLRWSPQHEVVIAVCRQRIDPTHAKNIERLMNAIMEPLAPAAAP